MKGKRTIIALNKLRGNSGQILGLPANPRKWNADNVAKLRKSLERDGHFLNYRPLLVYPYTDEREGDLYCVIDGNMRLYTLEKMGRDDATCMVLPEDTSIDELQRLAILGNSHTGEYDFDLLANFPQELLDDYNILEQADDDSELVDMFKGMDEDRYKESTEKDLDKFQLTLNIDKRYEDAVKAYIKEYSKESIVNNIVELCQNAEVKF